MNVTVAKNNGYWQARWTDRLGRRKGKSLGPCSRISERAAKKLAQKIQHENDTGQAPGNAPRLQEHCERVPAVRTELADRTKELYRQTSDRLMKFFAPHTRIDKITPSDASDWRAFLSNELSETSVCLHVRNAKSMFKLAVDEGLIRFNPFARLRSAPPTPDKDWAHIDLEDTFPRLIKACRNHQERMLIGLARLAGLRRSEIFRLKWEHVDLDRRRITIINPRRYQDSKHRRRQTPIRQELHTLLFDAWMDQDYNRTHVCPESGTVPTVAIRAIARRAGVKMWADCLHTLRKNCETDWYGLHRPHAVTEWLGNSTGVAEKHYVRAEDADFDRVIDTKSATNDRQ
jgi:integrase